MDSSASASALASGTYVPPAVWIFEAPASNKFSFNRPTAGSRFEKTLPIGKHPIQLYSLATPNGQKVTILLEELLEIGKDAEYDAWPINIMEEEQFGSDFVSMNPNSKIPSMRIYDGSSEPLNLFESGSILLHLSETYKAFVPADIAKRAATLNWLFWSIGCAPYLGGGFGHFYVYADEKQKYPIDRFTMEAKRQLDVLNKQLANNKYIIGDEYTIADIAIYPWYGNLVLGKSYKNSEIFLNVKEEYPNVIRWAKEISERPAVKRGVIVNKLVGEESEILRERHDAKDFENLKILSGEKRKLDDR